MFELKAASLLPSPQYLFSCQTRWLASSRSKALVRATGSAQGPVSTYLHPTGISFLVACTILFSAVTPNETRYAGCFVTAVDGCRRVAVSGVLVPASDGCVKRVNLAYIPSIFLDHILTGQIAWRDVNGTWVPL